MKKILRNILRVILIVITVIALFVIISLVRHKVCSSREKDLLTPLGELVEVNGHKMSVYTEGDGDKTLVFMSGGGTCSPILDFKSLYSLQEWKNCYALLLLTGNRKTNVKLKTANCL